MKPTQLMQSLPFSDIAMGNHALARAMVCAQTRVITTYPGSPTPEIADLLNRVPEGERPYYFEYSINEKVALELAAGASMNGHSAAVFFKSVGLNVAMDSMIQLPLLNLIGGMVIIVGDDPGANSSQNEQDNRHFARMAHMPMMEPASPSEAYTMYLAAAALSKKTASPVLIRTTTHVAHARERIDFDALPDADPDWTPRFDIANGPYWPIAAKVFPLKQRMLEKEAAFRSVSDESPLNTVFLGVGESPSEYGIIAAGLVSLSVRENIAADNAPVDLLKIGFSHPLPKRRILEFLNTHKHVYIIEELDRVMETEIKSIAFDARVSCRLIARPGIDGEMGELTPDRTASLLAAAWPNLFEAPAAVPTEPTPLRVPQLCPGCGHRSAFDAVKQALQAADITVGDIGCHTLGALAPYKMGELVLSMGHSISTGSGLALKNRTRKVIAFIGDGTLFHAGLPGIINAAVNNHNLTLVILENGTTAMTGHQPRPGTGEIGDKIPLPSLLAHLGVKFIRDVDAYNQTEIAECMRQAMTHEGLSVVIARHPCVLQLGRKLRKRRPEVAIPKITVDQSACTRCNRCVSEFGCPSFKLEETGKVAVETDLCIGDGSCIQVCTVGALIRKGVDRK